VARPHDRIHCHGAVAVSHLLSLRAYEAGRAATLVCDRNSDCFCDDDSSQAAKKSHAKSSVLAARICGNVLAPPDAWDNPEGSASGITPRNVLILGLGILWFLIKSIVEENFLRADPQYAVYLRRVRARWIPFVV
jgi:hypothetical protein